MEGSWGRDKIRLTHQGIGISVDKFKSNFDVRVKGISMLLK